MLTRLVRKAVAFGATSKFDYVKFPKIQFYFNFQFS